MYVSQNSKEYSESESSLLAKYISTYKEFFLGLIALNVLKLKNMHATV